MKPIQLRFAGIIEESVVDGPGLRAVLFFQGCPHRCPGCHNPQTWDFQGGLLADVEDIWDQIDSHPLLQGITLSGGEPLAQPEAALYLAKRAKARGWNVMLFTGYSWEAIETDPDPHIQALLGSIDLMVDGKYLHEERDGTLRYRGSRNQRLINVAATIARHTLTLWDGEPI